MKMVIMMNWIYIWKLIWLFVVIIKTHEEKLNSLQHFWATGTFKSLTPLTTSNNYTSMVQYDISSKHMAHHTSLSDKTSDFLGVHIHYRIIWVSYCVKMVNYWLKMVNYWHLKELAILLKDWCCSDWKTLQWIHLLFRVSDSTMVHTRFKISGNTIYIVNLTL